MMILSKQSTAFRSDYAQVVLLSHERHFVRRYPASILGKWSANTVKGMSDTLLQPMSFRFGKQSKLGVMNETR